jgi:hypothetical protein
MSSNICGNCANFKPKQGEKLFNCTVAQNAGVKYAMQVRADTRSCEAFSPLKQPPTLKAPAKPPPPAKKRAQPPAVLCNWGRLILIAAIVIIILLIGWGAYSCFSGGTPATSPTPTPTPTAAPTVTGVHPTPTPTPTPIPLNYYDFGDLVTSTPWQISIGQPAWTYTYNAPGPQNPPAGSIFLLVPVTLWNVGITPIQVSAPDFKLVSTAGAIYGAKPPPNTIVYPGWTLRSAFPYYPYSVQPSGLVTGIIIYTPPIVATDLSIRIFVNGQYLVWNVPPP